MQFKLIYEQAKDQPLNLLLLEKVKKQYNEVYVLSETQKMQLVLASIGRNKYISTWSTKSNKSSAKGKQCLLLTKLKGSRYLDPVSNVQNFLNR